jgi:hypothetical protein
VSAGVVERLRLLAAWRKPGGRTPEHKMPNEYRVITDALEVLEAAQACIVEMEAEVLENARIIGASGEREASHMARIAELEARLEVVPGLSQSADGIACRDDTIRLQDEQIPSLRAQLAQQQEDEAEMLAIVHMQGVASRDDEVRELKAQLKEMTRRRDEWRKRAEGFDAIRHALREKVGAPWPPNLSRALWAALAADEKKRADDAEAQLAEAREALGFIADMDDPGSEKERSATFYRIHAAMLKQAAAKALGRKVVSDEAMKWATEWLESDEGQAAIRVLIEPQEEKSVIRKPTELLTDNNRISGDSDAL